MHVSTIPLHTTTDAHILPSCTAIFDRKLYLVVEGVTNVHATPQNRYLTPLGFIINLLGTWYDVFHQHTNLIVYVREF